MDSTASHGSLITVRRFSCFTSYCSQGNQAVCPLTVSQLRHLYRELVEAFLFDALRTWILHFLIICLVLWWWMLLLQMVKASDSEFSYVPLVCEDRASDCFRRCFFFLHTLERVNQRPSWTQSSEYEIIEAPLTCCLTLPRGSQLGESSLKAGGLKDRGATVSSVRQLMMLRLKIR